MHPAGPYTPTNVPARSDNSGPPVEADLYEGLLASARLAADADSAERLERAYAGIEERLSRLAALPQDLMLARLEATAAAAERHADRIAASVATTEQPAVSVSQLRLVAGG